MRQARWQTYSPLLSQVRTLQDELNHVFHRWTDGSAQRGPGTYPAVNLWEDSEQVFVEAELPGLDAKDLEIHVTGGNQLHVKGERKACLPEKAVVHRQERAFGTFVRTISLPFHVDPDKVEASYENGVLQITLAKHEAAKVRKITVKGE